MTAASNTVPMLAGSQPVPTTRLLYCSIRRELWAHPFLYLAPLAAGAV